MSWLSQNAEVITAFANVALVTVWVLYAQLIYYRYRIGRRPRIIIHQAQGFGLDSTCLVINMCQAPIHIIGVIATAHTKERSFTRQVDDYRRVSPEEQASQNIESIIKQGPLNEGEFITLGAYDDLLREGTPHLFGDDDLLERETRQNYAERINALEIRVVAMFGTEDRPIGARRLFSIEPIDHGGRLRPQTLSTKQMTNPFERRAVVRWMKAIA